MRRVAAGAAIVALIAAIACAPIEGTPVSQGPMNECPCEGYVAPKAAPNFPKASCNTQQQCDARPGMPTYVAAVVVDVPDTSFYAPGRTFVLTRDDVTLVSESGSPACRPPSCVQLPVLVQGIGHYRVRNQAAIDVGFPQVVPENTPIPYRVAFDRLFGSGSAFASEFGLPVEPTFAVARIVRTPAAVDVSYSSAVAVGRYVRVAYPEPPYDAYFPPIETTLPVEAAFLDDLFLGDAKTPLDDPTGDFRTARIKRAAGLDGFRVWLVDQKSGRRISTVRPLTGAVADVRLDTVNEQKSSASAAIRDDVQIVLSPPEGVLAVPVYRSKLFLTSTNLGETEYPALPDPVPVGGVVAVGAGPNTLNGVPSRLTFTGNGILQQNGTLAPFLQYETTVSTDGKGRFATVLPPGVYFVTVEPAEGTGRAKVQEKTPLDLTQPKTDLVFSPDRTRTPVRGHVRLTDLRDVSNAEVRAIPKPPVTSIDVMPRPGRARTTADGRFTMELDPGQYDIVVDPQLGTGFPRVVTPAIVQAAPLELDTIEVPPPVRVNITFRDPNSNLQGNPIVRATVRVFATRVGSTAGSPLVEIARTMTSDIGSCEILLAQQPR